MKNFLIVSLIILSLTSCNRKKTNGTYIPRDTFVSILADIHLADAYYASHYEQRKVHNDSITFYNAILKNYGYNKAQFDTTLKYYSIHSDKFDLIYEDVITILSKTEQENFQIRPVDAELAFNIWFGKNSWYLPEEGTQKKIPIDLKLKGKGRYVISFIYKMYPDDQSKNSYVNLYLTGDSASKPKKDTLKTIHYSRDARTSIVTISKEIKDSTFTHLKGFLIDHEPKEGDWEKHVLIDGLRVYYIPKR